MARSPDVHSTRSPTKLDDRDGDQAKSGVQRNPFDGLSPKGLDEETVHDDDGRHRRPSYQAIQSEAEAGKTEQGNGW